MPMLLSAYLATQNAFVADSKLGTPYLLGTEQFVSGTKEKLDIGTQRWVTVRNVRTALMFPGRSRTFLAGKGEKLMLLDLTVRNPSSVGLVLGANPTGVAFLKTDTAIGPHDTIGCVDANGGDMVGTLKKGESADCTLVVKMPAAIDHLWFVLFYERETLRKGRRFDATKDVSFDSAYTTNGSKYADSIQVRPGTSFDFDWMQANVLGVEKRDDGYAVKVEYRNRTLLPVGWGWQYAKAILKGADGTSVDYYPDFMDASGKSLGGEVPAGKTVVGEYRFSVKGPFEPKEFSLSLSQSGRSVVVAF